MVLLLSSLPALRILHVAKRVKARIAALVATEIDLVITPTRNMVMSVKDLK